MASEEASTRQAAKAEGRRILSKLGVDHVDLMYPDWTCTPEQVEGMLELREQGATRFIGLLGLSMALESDLSGLDVVLVNHNYYMRKDEPDMRKLPRENLGIIGLEPLGRGRFALDDAPEGVSMVAACLKYALGFDVVDTVLVAVRRLEQLKENIAIWKGDLQLTDAELAALEKGRGYEIPSPR